MRIPATGDLPRPARRLLGHDEIPDLAWVAGLFAAFFVVDRVVQRAADVDAFRLDDQILLVAAARSNPVVFGLMLAAAAAAIRFGPSRILCRWEDLERGRVLRGFGAVLLVVAAWQLSLYPYNFLLGENHTVDRFLIVVWALVAVVRPIGLLPFIVHARIINDQFDYPFGSVAAQNVDELLVLCLVVLATGYTLYVFTGRKQTAPVALVIGAVLATHFTVPGRAKLSLDWVTHTEVANLPLAGYSAGWLGGGDGAWASDMASLIGKVEPLFLIGTLVLELGAAIAVVHHRLLRMFIPGWIVFHIVIFSLTGFWFLTWVAVEVSLLVILWSARNQSWLDQNATPARGLLAFGAVVMFGSTLFHPPGLGWIDASVSYGYEIEATGESGERYNVPISSFAPLEQELTFLRVQLRERPLATAGYGAVADPRTATALASLDSFEDLAIYESTLGTASNLDFSQEYIRRWMIAANDRGKTGWRVLSAPEHFWTGASSPRFDYQETVVAVEVFLVSSLHDGDGREQRELVLGLELDATGEPVIAGSPDG